MCVNALNRFYFMTTAGLVFSWRVLLRGVPLPVGQQTQVDPEMWHPGGSCIIEPQVPNPNLRFLRLQLTPPPLHSKDLAMAVFLASLVAFQFITYMFLLSMSW